MKITVALAEDHQLIRQGIKLLLNSMDEFEVLLEAGNGQELLDGLKETGVPGIALIDISMPVMDGFETMKRLHAEYPGIRCIALSVHSDFNSVFRMISSGAKAYLLKDCSPEVMKETILQVLEKGFYYSSFVVDSLTHYHQKQPDDLFQANHNLLGELSDREHEFIRHCCSELAYKEIASLMNVSPRTVDGYRESVFSKLNLKSRVSIVLFAIRNNLHVIAER